MALLKGLSVADFKRVGLKSGFSQFEEQPTSSGDISVLTFQAARFTTLGVFSIKNASGKFESLKLTTSFTDINNAKKVNDWNREFRFVKAVARDGVYFEMDLITIETTETILGAYFEIWIGTLFEIGNFDWD